MIGGREDSDDPALDISAILPFFGESCRKGPHKCRSAHATLAAMSDGLLHEVSDRVLTVTFDRPDKKNALTLAMYDAMTARLREAAEDPQVRVVLLRGAGGVFTAGNDLGDFMKNPPSSTDSPVGRFLETLIPYAKPIIAAVDGVAIGVGTTMLMHCDASYAAVGTKFSMPFVPLGLCPEAASSYLLPRIAGRARASELLLFGDRFGPETALELGLINAVLPVGEMQAHALARAKTLAELPPEAVRITKRLIRDGLNDGVHTALERESTLFFERLRSAEAAESMAAFFAKRKPDFSKFE